MNTTKQHNSNRSSCTNRAWLLGGFGQIGRFSAYRSTDGMLSGGRPGVSRGCRPVSTDVCDRLIPGHTAPAIG
jgi:hypothetical protein